MGKKNRGKNKRVAELAEEEGSEASNDTGFSLQRSENCEEDQLEENEVVEVDQEAEFEQFIEDISERSVHTRVEALEKVAKKLEQCLTIQSISSKRDSLMTNILGILRKPSAKEGEAGPRVLALAGLTLGEDEQEFYEDMLPVFENLVKNGKHEATRVACIEALALVCYMCAIEEECPVKLLKLFRRFFTTQTPVDVCVAACDAWGLLASTLGPEFLSEEASSEVIPELLHLLDHSDVDVRRAAGENVALIYEAVHLTGVVLHDKQPVLDRLHYLSSQNCKKTSKKDRKEQRVNFREIYATVANDEDPSVSLTVNDENLTFRGWGPIKQLSAIKKCLRTGFQEHLQYNNQIRTALDLPEADEATRPTKTKHAKTSDKRKQQASNLRKDRRRRENQKNSFMMDF